MKIQSKLSRFAKTTFLVAALAAGFVAPVKPGRVLYEIDGVSLDLATEALTRAAHKLPVKTVIVTKEII